MKRFRSNLLVMTAVLFLVGGTLAFASGQTEAPGAPGSSSATSQAAKVTVAKDLTTVTGTVQFVNLIHPVIKSGGTSYELIVPRADIYEAGLKEGQTVTVKGYAVTGGVWGPFQGSAQSADTAPRLLVSSATVNGKSYDLQQWADHFKLALQYRGTYGPRQGFRGPGPMMGYGQRGEHRGDWGPRGGRGQGFAPGYGMGYGPQFGPGFGPGMGYRFQNEAPNTQGQ